MNLKLKLAAGVTAGAFAAGLGVAAMATADSNKANVRGQLSGFQEVPALSTSGSGSFKAKVNAAGDQIDWELSFTGLESPVTQSHIHFENPTNSGPIVVFLCSNLGNGPAGTQACPGPGGTISGTITAKDVLGGAAANGIAAGEIQELVNAIRNGSAYVNVHSTGRPTGEIRAQLLTNEGRD